MRKADLALLSDGSYQNLCCGTAIWKAEGATQKTY